MNNIRVLMTKPFFPEDIAYLRDELVEDVELVQPREFNVETLAEAVRDRIDALLGDQIAKPILDNAVQLRLIQVPWTGVDRLDFDLLKQYPVAVCNSHSNAGVVAEYAVGLMMAAVKKIPYHDRQLRKGKWMRPSQNGGSAFFPPDTMYGKTVGFIGYGAIARSIAEMLGGFRVRFIAADAGDYVSPPAPLDLVVGPDAVGEVASESDILFIAVPLTKKTEGVVNKDLFQRMKPGSYLINVSRGEVVNEADLYHALKDRQIAGAAVDTWFNYPTRDNPDALPSVNFPFHELDNLVLSPHRSGFAAGELPHLADAVENLNRLATGEPLINRVDLEAGY
ncbi:MAG: hypothetical protein HYX78_08030 [Armatimonadetes bacterium]|nr:hypothetical protein [Armatimonadota bacterium]